MRFHRILTTSACLAPQGPLLGAETGVIGFGATGLSRGGSGNVPALGVSWNQVRMCPPFPHCCLLLFQIEPPLAALGRRAPLVFPASRPHYLERGMTPRWSLLHAAALPTLRCIRPLCAQGTNDGSTNITAAYIAVLNGLLAACPGTPIAVLLPFDGNQQANLQVRSDDGVGATRRVEAFVVCRLGFV